MFVIINNKNEVYNGSMSDTRHYWSKIQPWHFHAILFPLQSEAESINNRLGVEGTQVVPVSELK